MDQNDQTDDIQAITTVEGHVKVVAAGFKPAAGQSFKWLRERADLEYAPACQPIGNAPHGHRFVGNGPNLAADAQASTGAGGAGRIQ